MIVNLEGGPVNGMVSNPSISGKTKHIVITHLNCGCRWCKWRGTDHVYDKLEGVFTYQYSRESRQ